MTTAHNIKDRLNTPVEEAYKVLRTNIQFCSLEGKLKTLAISSCAPGEGKTTTSINLAISLAKSGARVLLIDADLRKPMMLKHISSVNPKGLSNLISETATLDEVISSTNVENLHLIACGPKPPNPAELLGTQKFGGLIEKLSNMFDIVILDTPPLGSVIDCAIIASRIDGVLLVVRAKKTSVQKAQKVKEQLDKVNARIIGVVLNGITKRDFKNCYSYYDYFDEKKRSRHSWLKRAVSKRRWQ